MIVIDQRQLDAYRRMMDLIGLKEIPGPEDHPWITESWDIVGAGWYDDDETPWCGLAVGRVLHDEGLPILKNGMSVQARAWHNDQWGRSIPLEKAVPGVLIVLERHVAFFHSFVKDKEGNITGFRLLGGNQSNRINIKTYPYTAKGRNKFLSARYWPGVNKPKPSANPFAALIAFLMKLFGGRK